MYLRDARAEFEATMLICNGNRHDHNGTLDLESRAPGVRRDLLQMTSHPDSAFGPGSS
jgi:hypothetical protein